MSCVLPLSGVVVLFLFVAYRVYIPAAAATRRRSILPMSIAAEALAGRSESANAADITAAAAAKIGIRSQRQQAAAENAEQQLDSRNLLW